MTRDGEPKDTPRSVLAFDFGLRRIGIAQAESRVRLASPIGALGARDGIPDWREVDTLVRDWQPEALVVGVPCEPDGSHGPGARPALAFSRLLEERYQLPIVLIDERLTSNAAEDILRTARRSGLRKRRVRKEDIDSLSARLIAEAWLDSVQISSDTAPEGDQ